MNGWQIAQVSRAMEFDESGDGRSFVSTADIDATRECFPRSQAGLIAHSIVQSSAPIKSSFS
jgi:hypothetical protein